MVSDSPLLTDGGDSVLRLNVFASGNSSLRPVACQLMHGCPNVRRKSRFAPGSAAGVRGVGGVRFRLLLRVVAELIVMRVMDGLNDRCCSSVVQKMDMMWVRGVSVILKTSVGGAR